MKKLLVFVVCFIFVLSMTGCVESKNAKEQSAGQEASQSTLSGGFEEAEIEVLDTYYKLRTEPFELDMEKLTKYLLGENASYYETGQPVEVVWEADRYVAEIEGVTYIWELEHSKNGYFYIKGESPFSGKVDVENGLEQAEEFAALIDLEVVPYVIIDDGYGEVPNEDDTMYTYRFAYKDVEFMSNQHVYYEEMENPLDGMWFDVDIDTTGIVVSSISNLQAVTEEVESYDSTVDFMPVTEMYEQAERYGSMYINRENAGLEEIEITGGVKRISVIYIPTADEDESYWMPAYRVECEYSVNGKTQKYAGIMDAFDGMVYFWQEVYDDNKIYRK